MKREFKTKVYQELVWYLIENYGNMLTYEEMIDFFDISQTRFYELKKEAEERFNNSDD